MSRPTTLRRAVVRLVAATVTVVVTTTAALLLTAAPASAHTRLLSSDPADGASLADPPTRVSLLFNEAIEAEFATVTVVGPDGTQYQTGAVSTSGGEVSTAVSPLGGVGVYTIGYRVVSDDGHPVQNAVSFTLTAPGPAAAVPTQPAPAPVAPVPAEPSPAAAPGPGATESGSTWPWLVGALVAVGAGGAAAAVVLRRRAGGVRR